MDELAHKANKDPIAFRRDMLGKTPRLQRVLDLVAEKSNWGQPLPPRVGRGVSVQPTFNTSIATVVEAEVDTSGDVYIRQVTLAVDCGVVVNQDTVVAEVEGGRLFGLSDALCVEI